MTNADEGRGYKIVALDVKGDEAKHVLDMLRDAAKIHAALYKAAYEYSMASSDNRLRRDFSGVTFGDYNLSLERQCVFILWDAGYGEAGSIAVKFEDILPYLEAQLEL